MDKLLAELGVRKCENCEYYEKNIDEYNCFECFESKMKINFEPNDTIKEIDRLIKLGRRYDTDTEINRVKECRWAKEVK